MTSPTHNAPSPARLQGQLDAYRHRLSDCVNCASANTPAGKAAIASLSAAIAQLEARIAGTTQAADQAERPPPSAVIGSLIDTFA